MSQAYFKEQTPKSFLQGLFEESSTQKQSHGTVMRLTDGREFVYVMNGAANLAVGLLCTAPAPIANKSNLVMPGANTGDYSFTIANIGAPAITANDYASGYAHINKGTALGYAYKIKSHANGTANSSLAVSLYDPIRLTTASANVTLVKCPHRGVIVCNATVAGDNPLVGVTVIPLTGVPARGHAALSTPSIQVEAALGREV